MAADIQAWGDDPDAYWVVVNPAAVGWAAPEGQ
jgi:hypothetical protein